TGSCGRPPYTACRSACSRRRCGRSSAPGSSRMQISPGCAVLGSAGISSPCRQVNLDGLILTRLYHGLRRLLSAARPALRCAACFSSTHRFTGNYSAAHTYNLKAQACPPGGRGLEHARGTMHRFTSRIRRPVKRQGAEQYILLTLLSFAASVILTRLFLELTGYPQLGGGTFHIAHVLWGGLLLFAAALMPLFIANRWVYTLGA